MRANRILGVGGIVLAAFAMGTLAQASTLDGVALSVDASLSMADTLGSGTVSSSFASTDLSFEACDDSSCSESEESAALISGGALPGAVSAATSASPEPATFVLVGLTLAVLPLMRKRRS
jgi:hypothetical protein